MRERQLRAQGEDGVGATAVATAEDARAASLVSRRIRSRIRYTWILSIPIRTDKMLDRSSPAPREVTFMIAHGSSVVG
jgi:hypothetical protein